MSADKVVDMEVDMVADMEVDKVADKVTDMVADNKKNCPTLSWPCKKFLTLNIFETDL